MKRTLEIDIETARNWWKSDNTSLATIALRLFSIDELKEPQPNIITNIITKHSTETEVSINNKWAVTLFKHELQQEFTGISGKLITGPGKLVTGHGPSMYLPVSGLPNTYGEWYTEDGKPIEGYLFFKPKSFNCETF